MSADTGRAPQAGGAACPGTAAVLSLGSNLGDRLGYLQLAVTGVGERVLAVSPVYETEPWGGVEQGDFLNAIVLAHSKTMGAWDWLRLCRSLETEAGRVRDVRWGPRTLDVDVVAVYRTDGEPVFSDDPELVLPHPGAAERGTVLRPWLDVDPDADLPGVGRVDALLAGLGPVGAADMRRCDDQLLVVR
ncbi:MAG TPA: 2-amino-4-hydroxy-6-hydroxymethyldihydropteridine diphosphokinase [Pseudonocardia sp.]